MRAVEIAQPGGPEVLQARRARPMPAPKAERDPDQGRGRGRQPPRRAAAQRQLPGAARRVGPARAWRSRAKWSPAGSSARIYKPGDKVCALVHGGGYAEYCVAPEVQALPVPKGLSLVEAASLPETFFTVWGNVYDRGAPRAGRDRCSCRAAPRASASPRSRWRRRPATACSPPPGSDEKVAACVRLGAEQGVQLQDAGLGRRSRRPPPAARAST